MSTHARFAPSSAHRWMLCNGSIALESSLPEGRTSSKYADEGTVAHEVGARCLKAGKDAVAYQGMIGVVDPEFGTTAFVDREQYEVSGETIGHLVNDDFATNVQVYLDYVRSWVDQGYTLLVEQQVFFSEAIGVKGQGGTSDTILISPDGTHIVVVDLKFGMGVKVYAKENHQMLSYGMGTLETFDMLGDYQTITLVVCQPRLDHIDEWPARDEPPLSVDRVIQHGQDMAHAAYNAQDAIAQWAMGEAGQQVVIDKHLNPGEKQCHWCRAQAICPKLSQAVADSVYDDFEAFDDPEAIAALPEPSVPAPERVGAIFNNLDMIENWCKAVRGEVTRMVFAGMTVIGIDNLPLRLGEGRKGHRYWTDPATAEGLLVGLLKPEQIYVPQEIVSPSKIDKILNKKKTKAQWETLKPYIDQPPGQPKVVLGSSSAPAYTGGAADIAEFTDLEDPTL